MVAPDYTHWYSRKAVLEAVFNINFTGPGLYISKDRTLMITPGPEIGERPNNHWADLDAWTENTHWDVHVYKAPFKETIFGQLCTAPVREDSTTKEPEKSS